MLVQDAVWVHVFGPCIPSVGAVPTPKAAGVAAVSKYQGFESVETAVLSTWYTTQDRALLPSRGGVNAWWTHPAPADVLAQAEDNKTKMGLKLKAWVRKKR